MNGMNQEQKELYYKLLNDCGALIEDCPNEEAGKRVLACEYCRFEYLRKAIAKEILTDLYNREEMGFDVIKWYAKAYYGLEVEE